LKEYADRLRRRVVVRLLLKKSANTEVKIEDSWAVTPLWVAAANGHEAVVGLLLEKGANIEAKDNLRGQMPLWWAKQNGHEVVVWLLQFNKDEDGVNDGAGNKYE
jgi:ankyrin repeat protein